MNHFSLSLTAFPDLDSSWCEIAYYRPISLWMVTNIFLSGGHMGSRVHEWDSEFFGLRSTWTQFSFYYAFVFVLKYFLSRDTKIIYYQNFNQNILLLIAFSPIFSTWEPLLHESMFFGQAEDNLNITLVFIYLFIYSIFNSKQ